MERMRHLIGLLVLAAAGIGGWWLVRTAQGQEREDGYRILVELADARGLRVGAQVRHRGVGVGEVRGVQLAPMAAGDEARVRAELWLQPEARTYARVNSRFWIVAPRFRGLTDGVSGLDTLVRDAYVAFATPAAGGPVLVQDTVVLGLDAPPDELDQARLPPVRPGDLLMQVMVPENFGLKAGSPVRFRGLDTGEVRNVALAEDGTHVAVTLRVRRGVRQTVTDAAQFWVARPGVDVGLLRGIQVDEVSALLEPYVAYHAEPGEGLPVEDGWRVLGLPERPSLDMAPVPGSALVVRAPGSGDPQAKADGPVQMVRVSYLGEERDYLSPNDEVRLAGSGMIYRDGQGRTLVLTARSACDGAFVTSDSFGDAEMINEQLRVAMGNGVVLRAKLLWVDPAGNDAAVLEVSDVPADLQLPAGLQIHKGADPEQDPDHLHSADEAGRPLRIPLPADGTPVSGDGVLIWRGAAACDAQGRVVGVLGGVTPASPLTVQGLVALPAECLPAEMQPTGDEGGSGR